MQVFIPSPDNGGINIGAVVGPVVSVVVGAVVLAIGLVCWKLFKKGKFVCSLNQVTRFAFMRCA